MMMTMMTTDADNDGDDDVDDDAEYRMMRVAMTTTNDYDDD